MPQAPFGEVFLCWVVDKFFGCFWVFDRVWEVGEGLILLGFLGDCLEFSIGVFHTLWITFLFLFLAMSH